MSANTTGITEGPNVSFIEETPGQLNGKEGYLVEPGTNPNSIKLLVTPGNEIGTFEGKLTPDTTHSKVRLLGSPGTARYVAGDPIAAGAPFKAAAGGKVVAGATGRVLGRSLYNGNTADEQRFLALPLVENK